MCPKTIWTATGCELRVLRRMRTDGLCRRILSGNWVERCGSRERRVRRPLWLKALPNQMQVKQPNRVDVALPKYLPSPFFLFPPHVSIAMTSRSDANSALYTLFYPYDSNDK